jgi:hypothetical protein
MNLEALIFLIKYEYLKSCNNLDKFKDKSKEERDKEQRTKLRNYRLLFEPYIFNYLLLKYGNFLDNFWKDYLPPKKADKAFVIVERRCHPNFWFVLRNIAWARPDMSVYIFCSKDNINYIIGLLGDKINNFNIILAFKDDIPEDKAMPEYNYLLANHRFYEVIEAEWILNVQMDVFLRRKIPDSIFIGTYWGYPFGWRPEYAGGGGTSIRNVKKIHEICKADRSNTQIEDGFIEDVYFCEKMLELNEFIPSFEFRREYLMENVPSNNPYVVHQFWTYIDSYANILDTPEFAMYLNKLLSLEI